MIRPGKQDDVALIDPFDPFGESREEEISEGRLHVFENEHGEPVGYISVAGYRFHGFLYITFLLVHPDHLRKGIASDLLRHVEGLNAGQRLFISTEADNQPMLALLKRESYKWSGALGGLNAHSGVEEVFFYKDV
jgi:ribosomal protein S18 acetylase RimI-like enzyme